jgi:hypothetical protein
MDREENSSREIPIYRIKIDGRLHGKWAQWLNGTIIKIQETTHSTVISTVVPDQAALRGLMNKLWDLNLTILSMTHQEDESKIGEHNGT